MKPMKYRKGIILLFSLILNAVLIIVALRMINTPETSFGRISNDGSTSGIFSVPDSDVKDSGAVSDPPVTAAFQADTTDFVATHRALKALGIPNQWIKYALVPMINAHYGRQIRSAYHDGMVAPSWKTFDPNVSEADTGSAVKLMEKWILERSLIQKTLFGSDPSEERARFPLYRAFDLDIEDTASDSILRRITGELDEGQKRELLGLFRESRPSRKELLDAVQKRFGPELANRLVIDGIESDEADSLGH